MFVLAQPQNARRGGKSGHGQQPTLRGRRRDEFPRKGRRTALIVMLHGRSKERGRRSDRASTRSNVRLMAGAIQPSPDSRVCCARGGPKQGCFVLGAGVGERLSPLQSQLRRRRAFLEAGHFDFIATTIAERLRQADAGSAGAVHPSAIDRHRDLGQAVAEGSPRAGERPGVGRVCRGGRAPCRHCRRGACYG